MTCKVNKFYGMVEWKVCTKSKGELNYKKKPKTTKAKT